MSSRHEEVVYFIRAGDAVKIGHTKNVPSRLRALATASAVRLQVLATVPGGRDREDREHQRWSHLRIRGEWFRADEGLLRYAQDLATGPRVVELSPAQRAQAAQFRRVLQALGPADLAGLR
jgi:hypothetical protein